MKKITIIFAIFLSCATTFAKEFDLKHVEPLHWWVGMHRPELQIMVHGENISALVPKINYPGVTLVSVEKTDNKNYLFINLTISDTTKPGRFTIEFIGADKTLAQVDYRLESRDAHSAQRLGFSAKDAIYLLMPDRFANGESANDTQKKLSESVNRKFSGGRHGGDIKGMYHHLDYIADMGFTMMWPTPLIENNQEKYSYHGYSATDHYKIDARFGTNDDYKKFVAAANKKGVGVIQDIVLNHIGSGHWWMNDMPASDWINFPKNFVQTTHKRTTLHDIHAAPEDKTLFSDGWFVDTMPDVNQRNNVLATYLIQNSIWWIEYANLSGIREDTYSYSDKEFLALWTKAILDEYPRFNIVGEEWTNNAAIVASWQKGKFNADGYVSHLPSLMDFPVHDALRAALTEDEGDAKGFIKIYEALANDFLYADPMNMVVFAENHDTSRIFSVLDESTDLLKTALLFTATTRGIPQFFYGTEVLLTSPKERDDGAVRADMPGGWQGDRVNAFTGKNLTEAQIDLQSYLKHLLNWRKTSAAIQEGKLIHYVPERSTYVYFRITATQKVMVILNKNKKPISLNLARFESVLKAKQQGTDVFTNKKIDLTQPLQLAPMTSMLIELND
jgi:neopullulanase